MKIRSIATEQESLSPFLKRNKDLCYDFESFIAQQDGKIKGNYNASSYLIFGKIFKYKKWELMYKKSTFTNTGNFLLSSKKQSLYHEGEWTVEFKSNNHINFEIRQRTFLDRIRSIPHFSGFEKYSIKNQNNESSLIKELRKILSVLFEFNEIHSVCLKQNQLTIRLHAEELHLDIFEKLISSKEFKNHN